jgi:hypothetical protein
MKIEIQDDAGIYVGYGCEECVYNIKPHLSKPCSHCAVAHPTRAFLFFKKKPEIDDIMQYSDVVDKGPG